MSRPWSSRPRNYKYCIVPRCTNTTIKTPDKYFFDVPREQKLRKKWCQIMGRDDKVPLSSKSVLHCCEDHFNLETDVENFMRCRFIGGRMKLRWGVLPSKFDCQQRLKHSSIPQPASKKCQRKELVEASISHQQPPFEFISIKEEYDPLYIPEVDEECQTKKVKVKCEVKCEELVFNMQEDIHSCK